MKSIVLLSTLLLTSCAVTRIERSVEKQNDALKNESMYRYSDSTKKDIDSPWKEQLAKCYANDTDEGKEGLRQLMNEYRYSASYWNALGTCNYLEEDYVKASYYFDMAINIAKKKKRFFSPSYNNKALIAIKMQHFDQAISILEDINKKDPGFKTAHYNLALSYLFIGRYDSAISKLNRLYRANRKDADIVSSLAISYLLKGKNKTAIKLFEELDPKWHSRGDNSIYYGLALYKAGKLNESLEVINKNNTKGIKDIDEMVARLSDYVEHHLELKEEASNI